LSLFYHKRWEKTIGIGGRSSIGYQESKKKATASAVAYRFTNL